MAGHTKRALPWDSNSPRRLPLIELSCSARHKGKQKQTAHRLPWLKKRWTTVAYDLKDYPKDHRTDNCDEDVRHEENPDVQAQGQDKSGAFVLPPGTPC